MAFEGLAEKFREIEDDIKRNTNFPPPPPQQQSADVPPADIKPVSRLADMISDTNPKTTDYSISAEYQNFYGGGTTLSGKLATGVHSGTETYEQLNPTKIKEKTVNLSRLGTAGKLGKGNFVLESLYDVNHKNNPDRKPIELGTTDFDGNPLIINTTRPGMGTLTNLDIQGYSSNEISYRGPDRGDEPYFINPIGSKEGPEDQKSRILKFYRSPAGINAVLKENITNFIYRRANQKYGIDKIVFPAVPALGTTTTQRAGLGLGVGQADAFVNDLGNTVGGLRNIFQIEYSKRPNFGLPFKNLGDGFKPPTEGFEFFDDLSTNQLGLDVTARNLDAKSDDKYKVKKKLDWILEKTPDIKLKRIKKNPFFDLSGGPGAFNDKLLGTKIRGYYDRLGDTATVEDEYKKIFEDYNTKDTDFYVRFKDLRNGNHVYFRGYVTGITENVSPSYSSTNYIGRSEPVYMYDKTDRDVSFNLRLYPQNKNEQDVIYNKLEILTGLCYPEYMQTFYTEQTGTDDAGQPITNETVDSTRMKAPFTELYMAHIGSKAKGQFGYIKSLSYTVNESGDWDAINSLPRLFDVAISYQILNKIAPSITTGFYKVGGGNVEV